MAGPLFVSCLGLVSPVGLTPESTAAAMRASINGFTEIFSSDNEEESIIGAVVPNLQDDLHGPERLVELLIGAFAGVKTRLPQDYRVDRLPLLFCTREPDQHSRTLRGIVAKVEARLGFTFGRAGSSHIPRGRVAGFEALAQARRMFNERRADACLVAAADALTDTRSLYELDCAKRLKTSRQPDGVIPGEAACVALVTARPVSPSSLAVLGEGFAMETATVLNEEPLLGKGMAAAAEAALTEAGIAMHQVDFRLSDVAGESYGFEELTLAQARLMRQVRPSQPLWHPADKVGDCGAVAGLIQFAWAEQAFARSYAPGQLGLIHGSNATGERAAAVVASGAQP